MDEFGDYNGVDCGCQSCQQANIERSVVEPLPTPGTSTTSSANQGGMKYDQGKPQLAWLRLDLLPFDSLLWVSKVLIYGAQKYAAHSWRTVPNAKERYLSALLRHWACIQSGETLDSESGLPHAAHLACNAIFYCALECAEKGLL